MHLSILNKKPKSFTGKNYMNVLLQTVQWKSSQTAGPRLRSPRSSAGTLRSPGSDREVLCRAPGGNHERRDPSVQRRERQCYRRVSSLLSEF